MPFTNELQESNEKAKICYICKNSSKINTLMIKYRIRGHCHYTCKYEGIAHNIWNSKYSTPSDITVLIQNESN